ncbi:MAG: VanZ family protein [Burkholderiales bacterium]
MTTNLNRPATLWRVALALLVGTVLYLALVPHPPKTTDLGWDKLNHLAAFTTLTIVAFRAYGQARWRAAAGLLAFGALIEVLQAVTPSRSSEWADVLADALGIAAGSLLVALLGWLRMAARRRVSM